MRFLANKIPVFSYFETRTPRSLVCFSFYVLTLFFGNFWLNYSCFALHIMFYCSKLFLPCFHFFRLLLKSLSIQFVGYFWKCHLTKATYPTKDLLGNYTQSKNNGETYDVISVSLNRGKVCNIVDFISARTQNFARVLIRDIKDKVPSSNWLEVTGAITS